MAPEGDNDVVLKFKQQGGEDVVKTIDSFDAAMKKTLDTMANVNKGLETFRTKGEAAFSEQKIQQQIKSTIDGFKGIEGGGNLVTKALDGIQGGIGKASDALKAGGASTGLFSIGLDTMNQGLTILRNPLAAVATGVVAFGKYLNDVANEALNTAAALRQLAALTGETAERSEDIAGAFERAGVSQTAFQVGLFRMSAEVETGGKGLQKLGVDVRDSSGELKTSGAILLEVRDRIAAIPDATTRAAAAAQLFGSRMGKEFAEAVGKSREEFEGLMKESEKFSSANPTFLAEADKTKNMWKNVADAQQKYNSEVAQYLALPVSQVLAQHAMALVKLKDAVLGGVFRGLSTLFGITGAQAAEEDAAVQKRLMEQAKLVDDFKKGRAQATPKRLTDVEAAEQIARLNSDAEFEGRRLRMTQQFEAERLRVETGAASAGLQLQLQTNEDLVRIENERFQKVQETRQRTLLPGGKLDSKETERLEKEHQSRLLEIEVEGNRLRLQQQQAFADEYRQKMELRIKVEQAAMENNLAVLKTAYTAEKAVISLFSDTRVQQSRETVQAEERDAKGSADMRINNIRRQETELRDFAAKFPQLHQVQIDTQNRLMDLNKQRIGIEQETNQRLIESRRSYLEQVKQMADQEASIGESIEQKALGRLQKRGKKFVTAEDISQERMRMGEEAGETFGRFATGGRVSIEALQESRQYGKQRAQLQELGTTAAGASGMFQAQQAAAFGGRPFRAIPTALQGQAGEIQAMAESLMSIAGRQAETTGMLGDAATRVVGQVQQTEAAFVEKLDTIGTAFADTVKRLPDYIMDKILRKMEFEAGQR